MANHLQVSRPAPDNLDDEEDYEEMPEGRAVLAEREHGAAMIRVLEQQNAQLAQQVVQLTQHVAQLTQQVTQLVQRGFDERQNELLDRQNERQYLGAHLQQHAGGQADQQGGGHALAGALRALADALN